MDDVSDVGALKLAVAICHLARQDANDATSPHQTEAATFLTCDFASQVREVLASGHTGDVNWSRFFLGQGRMRGQPKCRAL